MTKDLRHSQEQLFKFTFPTSWFNQSLEDTDILSSVDLLQNFQFIPS